MLIYICPLVAQYVIDNNKIELFNSCWLYAPLIINCLNNDQADFENQKNIFFKKISEEFSEVELEIFIKEGISPGSEFNKKCDNIFKLDKKITLKDITNNFDEYIKKDNKSKRFIYNKLHDLLEENGPLVLQHPAFGSGSIHRAALTGVILGKNSQTQKEEIFLILNDTMEKRLKATIINDFLETDRSKEMDSYFLTSSEKKFQIPNKFTFEEFANKVKNLSSKNGQDNLKIDLISCKIDTIIDPKSMQSALVHEKILPPKKFFSAKKEKIETKMFLERCNLF